MDLEQAIRYLQNRMVSDGIKSIHEKIEDVRKEGFEVVQHGVLSIYRYKLVGELKRKGFTVLPKDGKHSTRLIAIKQK